MCQVCKKVTGMTTPQALEAIGKAMESGKNPDHFQGILDKLLGTEAPLDDQELDTVWENSTRGDRK